MKKIRTWLIILAILTSFLGGFLSSIAMAQESCKEWVAKVVSMQGNVLARKAGETQWVPVKLNDTYCSGDMIRLEEQSRAAVVLPNEIILRLDQKTTIIFSGLEKKRTSLLDLLKGAVHFFSRTPRSLKVATPFVNGSVEGTEFFVSVKRDQTFFSVFEGRIAATNEAGSLSLVSGQSATARAGQAPALRIVVRPRDAIQWALYYPPILDYRPIDFPSGSKTDWQAMIRKSLEFYWEGDLSSAFSRLEGAPEDIGDPRFFTYRAGLFLTVGRVDEARSDIDKALRLDPSNSQAFALQSIIAVVQNRKDQALELASKAVDLAPKSSTALVALSYALQANFDLQGALNNLQGAAKLGPENALAWARLAELWLSVGDLDSALETAKEAVALNPKLAHTQTVLGFTHLTKIKTQDSKEAFEKAIELDQAAPLPRLGLGLAKIREGDLEAGRHEIEIAAGLDPNNALIRSYLGKAYFEEKRDTLAADQYAIAKELDPLDPTPWFYDAIRKQTVNRPVEALQDLQKSIELNDNRAVYRSRLLLDEDLAARSASLGRIYRDLGFEQLALVEGWKSVNIDPANYSAHRFLADTYSTLPRHEIARVSELLQSQLLQPINITPVQPSLAEGDVFLLEGSGPAEPSFNEFNPLFLRNRLALQASGVIGENDTYGEEVVHSGVWGKMSYSLGQFHHETDGFRENNDQELDIYNAFAQIALSHKTSIQVEYRDKHTENGYLPLLYDDVVWRFFREEDDRQSIRTGLRYSFGPNSDLIASFIDLESDNEMTITPTTTWITETDGYMAEVQHLFRSGRLNVVSGAGYFSADRKATDIYSYGTFINDFNIRHTNLYVYAQLNFPQNVWWTLGGSGDFYKDDILDLDEGQFNPKVGVTWNPYPGTTVRAAVFRTMKRDLISNQTIEPTQVAGFMQFFDDGNAADTKRYGIAIDQKISSYLYAGAEFSKRDVEEFGLFPPSPAVQKFDSEEYLYRAYIFWTPHPLLALGPEYQFERFKNPPEFSKDEQIERLNIHRFSFGINFFHPCGFSMRVKPTYINEDGKLVRPPTGPPPPFFSSVPAEDHFWVVDASMSYRLSKRKGLISIEVKNLFDKDFNFQDTDPSNPDIYPERVILAKFTLAF